MQRASPCTRSRRGSRALALALAAGGAPAGALAGTWSVTPELSVGGEYSSNPQLRPDAPQAGEAATLHVGAPLDWNGDARHVQITPRARVGAAGGDSAIGADAYYLTGAADFDWERDRIAASAAVADDSGVVRQPEAGTLTRSDVRQHKVNSSLAWTRALTERTKLEVSGTAQRLAYGHRPDVGLLDYRYRDFSGSLTRRVTERVSLQFRAGRTHYDLPDSSYREDGSYQQVGVLGQLDPLWSYRALYGRSRVSSVGDRQHPVGAVYLAALSRTSERASLSLSTERSLQPSGFGVLVQTRETKAGVSWALSERQSISANWRSVDTSSAIGALTIADRRYESIGAQLTWQVAEHWDLNVELTHNRGETAAVLGSAASTGQGTGGVIAFSRHFGRQRLT